MNFKKGNADRIVSVSAILVSLGTLVMILYQTNLMRKEQRASAMPALTIGYALSEEDGYLTEAVWIENRGLGPAFVESVKIIDEEGAFETDPYDYVRKRLEADEIKHYNRLYAGRILPADEGFTMVRKRTDSTSTMLFSNTFEFLTKISSMPQDKENKAVIEVLYESIYGDQWVVRSDEPGRRRVD